METTEKAFQRLMNTRDYWDCVLTCVNMGYDADSTAVVAGGGWSTTQNLMDWLQAEDTGSKLIEIYQHLRERVE